MHVIARDQKIGLERVIVKIHGIVDRANQTPRRCDDVQFRCARRHALGRESERGEHGRRGLQATLPAFRHRVGRDAGRSGAGSIGVIVWNRPRRAGNRSGRVVPRVKQQQQQRDRAVGAPPETRARASMSSANSVSPIRDRNGRMSCQDFDSSTMRCAIAPFGRTQLGPRRTWQNANILTCRYHYSCPDRVFLYNHNTLITAEGTEGAEESYAPSVPSAVTTTDNWHRPPSAVTTTDDWDLLPRQEPTVGLTPLR